MERGTYISASAGMLQLRKLEVANNNLTNVNTPGFKRQVLVSTEQTFDQTLASQMNLPDPYAQADHERTPGTVNVRTTTDFTPGPIKSTGNTLDVALSNPKDFFVVNTPAGQRYTRAGNFTLNATGEIVTQDGYTVIGDGGPITVNGPGVSIAPNGRVLVNGQSAGNFQVVRFEDPGVLEKDGGTRFVLPAGQPAPQTVDAGVVPGSLEMSNVSAISSVIDLMGANRAFDMYVRTARSIDEMNQTSITQVGRRR